MAYFYQGSKGLRNQSLKHNTYTTLLCKICKMERKRKMYLQVKDMKKSYGEGGSYIQVLKGISTGVEKGEMCVIEGTSGSGKSTFLNCIGGLDVLDSGSIMVDGIEIVGMKADKLSDYRRY